VMQLEVDDARPAPHAGSSLPAPHAGLEVDDARPATRRPFVARRTLR